MIAFSLSVSLGSRCAKHGLALCARESVLKSRALPPVSWIVRRGAVTTPTARATSGALPRDALLKKCETRGVSREIAERVFSLAERAVRDWTAFTSEFLTPPEADAIIATFSEMADVSVEAWGGYPSAERRAVVVARTDIVEVGEEGSAQKLAGEDLVVLSVTGNFLFDSASHRDFLGSLPKHSCFPFISSYQHLIS
jgi:hypothetical protein